MFIGHFAAAFLIGYMFPGVPIIIPLLGVSFPDILWSILVISGVEKAKFDKNKPLMSDIVFESYPVSHSLVLTSILALIIGLVLALFLKNPFIAVIFVIASISHWILDVMVHIKDLPVFGFSSKDIKFGFGLWRRGPLAFVAEYLFYIIIAIITVSMPYLLFILFLGTVFHFININAFFGFKNEDVTGGSSRRYALLILAIFVLFILFSQIILG
ncbi:MULTISPECIES: hypothetical protein [Methanobacterium]|jgi:hypothetical protein|uniref:Metal-dependent hydrolase n=1 Tax=Methanobacterium veterum TaxID=408577 RepID=A0A9E5A0N9_9EURY|nr:MULTISPECIES: hypothetical protein [Methanobacterium]MCZ3365586.1 hypothetical protein [Methanobacterium veterum]MCZ3371049.1 hypothetical protein [Methanobacterium veterum]